MRIQGRLLAGRFVSRDNRFRVTIDLDGEHHWAHLANSGRLGELLVPGSRVLIAERAASHRKTAYDLALVEMDGHWVSVDARLPNDLLAEALRRGALPELAGYSTIRREVTHGRSRFDFALEAESQPPCLVEVKSVTLVQDGLGCFPDAVTQRGRKHVEELAAALGQGYRAVIVFVVQRDDATAVRPHDESDPDFGRALRVAAGRGVEVLAYACRVEPPTIRIHRPLPVLLRVG